MRAAALLLLAALFAARPAAAAESHPEVVVIVNASSPRSVAIGEHYARARGVPPGNVARLAIALRDPTLASNAHEVLSRARFVAEIRDPLLRFLAGLEGAAGATPIRVLVTVKGVPHTVVEASVPEATYLRDARTAAIDAELAILGSGRDGAPGVVGMANPYFDSALSFDEFRTRHPQAPLRYVVGRIDAYPADVEDLIERAQAPVPAGAPRRWLVDEDPTGAPGRLPANEAFLRPAAALLRALGQDVRHDATQTFVGGVGSLAGYASWGSNDSHRPAHPYYGTIAGRTYPGRFAPRAIAIDLVSTNARTFTPHPPVASEQSLIADLLRLGAAGAAGNVAEPFLGGVARPYILLRRYAEGVPAGEAHLRAVPYLGWMNTWIGDPLLALPAPAAARPGPAAGDLDGDGVANGEDNCLYLANRDQRDADGDGIGSLCDPDLDQDGVVTTSWGRLEPRGDLERIALAARPGAAYDPLCDLDGDRKVDAADLGLAQLWLFLPPGPRGAPALPAPHQP